MINTLRSNFGGGDCLITGAPHCPLSTQYFQMQQMIQSAKFDIFRLQFYNNPSCDGLNGGFNFDSWTQFLPSTPSANALLFVGLPGSSSAAGSGCLSQSKLQTLIQTYSSRKNFGGVMLWDTYWAKNNVDSSGKNYIQAVKSVLGLSSTSFTPTPTQAKVCTDTYTVQYGDCCYLIATNSGITVDELEALNPFLDSTCSIHPGEALCLATGPAPPQATTSAPVPAMTWTCTKTCTVLSGDNCFSIRQKYGASVVQLQS